MAVLDSVDDLEPDTPPLKRKFETFHGCQLKRASNFRSNSIPSYYQEGPSSPPKKHKTILNSNQDVFSFVSTAPINLQNDNQCLFEPMTGNSHHVTTSLRMIRSNGAIEPVPRSYSQEFPFETFYDNQPSPRSDILQPIEPNSAANVITTDSSGFIVPPSTGSCSDFLQTPTPNEFNDVIVSPHNPPFEANQRVQGIRISIIETQNIFTAPSSRLNGLMEERLIRWRPSESQMNAEASLNGKHPFQTSFYDCKKDSKNIFNSLSSWMFKQKLEVSETDVKQQLDKQQSQQGEQDSDSPDFNRILSLKKLKPNSSNSILNPLNLQPVINGQPLPTSEPVYTPKAIPFSEFQLNFDNEKSNGLPAQTGPQLNNFGNSEDFDSFDRNFVDIFDDIDNCVLGCIESITNTFDALGRCLRQSC